MAGIASDLSRQLARNAEAVCRHYLAAGHREGRYWIAGDIQGSKGRSLYVRLKGGEHGKGAPGKWTDAATGEHGDLLDLIGLHFGHCLLSDTLDEARRFLALPREISDFDPDEPAASRGSRRAAQRLFAASRPIAGTLGERYLRARGITGIRSERWLRFHPRCWYRPSAEDHPGTPNAFPALIAAVTDDDGMITGCHRTWLYPDGSGKAPTATPRRAMGDLLGMGVRFGRATTVMIAGEGLETVLSVRTASLRRSNGSMSPAIVIPREPMRSANFGIAQPMPALRCSISSRRRTTSTPTCSIWGSIAFASSSERSFASTISIA
jgi:hypothetical protein